MKTAAFVGTPLTGMGVSGVVFGLAGYLLGSRYGMRRARELMK